MIDFPPFIFFGTPYVARDTLATLIDAGHRPLLVVTNPDAPAGRGQTITPCLTKQYATEHDIPVYTPATLDAEAVTTILKHNGVLGICVAYGKILPSALISAFPLGILNVHYSLLPRYRGATPVEATLLNGDTETGVTIQRMVPALDAGDIIAQAQISILPEETTRELRPRLITLGATLLLETVPAYVTGTLVATPQDAHRATHVGKLKKQDGELDLKDSQETNWRKYRAFAEWPGTFFIHHGKRVKITRAHRDTNGSFIIDRVIPEGKREVEASLFFQSAGA